MNARNEDKTNVMRLLEQKKIPYTPYILDRKEAVSAVSAARLMGIDAGRVFKTLVTRGRSGQLYVFVIPGERELDLKKAASAVGEKAVSMILSKELLPLTGYIHGGCSPIGMKKLYPTTLDAAARGCETIVFSAGKIGHHVEVAPAELEKVIRLRYADVTVEPE